jgi:hypothetical protein
MGLTYISLLQVQLEVYQIPLGLERFKSYIKTILNEDSDDIELAPLAEMNPMANIRVSLVVVDDAKGGWTNRYLNDFQYAFEFDKASFLKRPWLMVPCWTNEEPSRDKIYNDTLIHLHRLAYVFEHGQAKTLAQMMQQEGFILARANVKQWLSQDDLAYSREVLKPLLETTEKPLQVSYLYGDEAAKSVGYQPLGLSARAGFAVALDNVK